jgi:hypothetical protein
VRKDLGGVSSKFSGFRARKKIKKCNKNFKTKKLNSTRFRLGEMLRLEKMFRTMASSMSMNASLNEESNGNGPMVKYRATCSMTTSVTRTFKTWLPELLYMLILNFTLDFTTTFKCIKQNPYKSLNIKKLCD